MRRNLPLNRFGELVRKLDFLLIVLPLAACTSMTPGQRIALYCNPVAEAGNLVLVGAWLGTIWYTLGGGIELITAKEAFPLYHCLNAIKDKQNEIERKDSIDCPALDPQTRALLGRCEFIPESDEAIIEAPSEPRAVALSLESED